MRIVLKIILTFVALFFTSWLIGLGGTAALHTILIFSMMAAIVAIWRYNPEKKNETTLNNIDKTELNKK